MSSYSEKLKNFRAKVKTIKNIEIIIGVVIICIVVLIYSTVTSKPESNKISGLSDNKSYGENATELEMRLGEILSEIDGAGRVSVMISQETCEDGASAEGQIKASGVVIVADGADNVMVRMNLITATKTLLDVDADAIQIFDRNNK